METNERSSGGTMPDSPAKANNVPILQARNVSKHFGSVSALENVDFELYPNEILAVVGDNGAGKSTLIKILSGAYQPDEGELLMDGQHVSFKNPMDARRHGIETVYQDLALAAALDIASNLFLGREERRAGLVGSLLRALDKVRMRREAADHMSSLKIGLRSMRQPVETLSGGQRQGVAVARAVSWGKRVVIMDEPTAALGVKESGMVLELIKAVKARGVPVVLISHNLPHVFQVADRILVMRLGKRAGIAKPGEQTMEDVVALMTGASRAEIAAAAG
ncbi:MAG: sugar transporter ATP-binding protein [Chloroflexi bacterium]|jgi:fructose transport system ATP-binding protein|nr:sugar transporter ATP-binding protein [Chloroflexota bacterium]